MKTTSPASQSLNKCNQPPKGPEELPADHEQSLGSPSAFSESLNTSPLRDHLATVPEISEHLNIDSVPIRRFARPDSGDGLHDVVIFAPKLATLHTNPNSGHQDGATSDSREDYSEIVCLFDRKHSLIANTSTKAYKLASAADDDHEATEFQDRLTHESVNMQPARVMGIELASKHDGGTVSECVQEKVALAAASSANNHTIANAKDTEGKDVTDTTATHSSSSLQQLDAQQSLSSIPADTTPQWNEQLEHPSNQEEGELDRIEQSEKSLLFSLAPLNHNHAHKISKPLQRRLNSRSVPRSPTSPTPSATRSSSHMPSEEELLQFLMQRTRQRDMEAVRALEQCKYVQSRDAETRSNNVKLKDQLEAVGIQLKNAMVENASVHDRLSVFTSKYQKIKNWALEMNREYANLKQQGDDVKITLSKVVREKSVLIESIRSLMEAQNKTGLTLTNMQRSTADNRVMLAGVSQQLHQKTLEVETLRSDLLKEAHEKRKLESHTIVLTNHQIAFDKKNLLRDQNLTRILQALTDRVTTVEYQSNHRPLEEQVLQAIQTIAERPIISPEDIASFGKLFQSVFEKLDQMKLDLVNSAQATSDNASLHINTSFLEAIDSAIRKLMPDLDHLGELGKVQARLEERVKGRDALWQASETVKHSAEAREVELQRLIRKLVEDLTRTSQQQKAMEAKVVHDLEGRASELSVRWILASKALEKTEIRLSESKQQTEILLQQLEQVEKQRSYDLNGAQAEAQKHFQCKLSQLQTAKANAERDMAAGHATEAKSWVLSMARVHLSLKEERNQHSETKEKLKQHISEENRLEREVATAKQEVLEYRRQIGNLNQDLSETDRNLKETQALADQIPALTVEIKSKNKELDDLQSQLAEQDRVKQELSNSQAQLDKYRQQQEDDRSSNQRLDEELVKVTLHRDTIAILHHELQIDLERMGHESLELRTKLEAAEAVCSTINDTKRDHAASQKQSKELQGQLMSAQKIITDLKHLQNELEAAHENVKQIPILLDEKKGLQEQLYKSNSGLEHAQESVHKAALLQESILRKDETIADLRSKEDMLNAVTKLLQDQKEESQRKEIEISSLKALIADLKKDLHETNQVMKLSPENDIEKFFAQSQDTVLSLKTQVIPDDQDSSISQSNVDRCVNQSAVQVQPQPPQRRVADRSGGINPQLLLIHPINPPHPSRLVDQSHEEQIIIPDSQNETDGIGAKDESGALIDRPLRSRCSSSELTDLSDGHEDSPFTDEDDVYDIPKSSPRASRGRGPSGHRRATSVASQESMLLQATPGGRKAPGAKSTVTRIPDSYPTHGGVTAVQHAILVEPSSGRLRSESQGRSSTPFPETQTNITNTRPQSNSAVKRRGNPPPETGPASKRLKRTPANLQLRPIHTDARSSTETPQADPAPASSVPPSTFRSANTDIVNTVIPARSQRKPKQRSRKSTKNERYAAQFTSAAAGD